MTLYRHFASKDELVAEYLRCLADKASSSWDALAAQHPGNPRGQLRGWLEDMASHVASGDERGCPLANAAVELPERDHPARRVIEAFKTAQRQRIIELCSAAELAEPEMLADELFLLLEGARVTAQSMGREGLGDRLIRMGEAMIAAHDRVPVGGMDGERYQFFSLSFFCPHPQLPAKKSCFFCPPPAERFRLAPYGRSRNLKI